MRQCECLEQVKLSHSDRAEEYLSMEMGIDLGEGAQETCWVKECSMYWLNNGWEVHIFIKT